MRRMVTVLTRTLVYYIFIGHFSVVLTTVHLYWQLRLCVGECGDSVPHDGHLGMHHCFPDSLFEVFGGDSGDALLHEPLDHGLIVKICLSDVVPREHPFSVSPEPFYASVINWAIRGIKDQMDSSTSGVASNIFVVMESEVIKKEISLPSPPKNPHFLKKSLKRFSSNALGVERHSQNFTI
jgi:hypothetical protein